MEEYTFTDFLKEKREQYKNNIFNLLGQELYPKKKHEDQTKYRLAVREYRKTEEFQKAFADRLNSDKRYQMLCSEERARKDRRLQAEYKEKRRQKNEEIQKKTQEDAVNEAILKRIPQNPVDLFPAARNLNRHFILHIGETNSGKTHDALEALKKADTGIYLGPLRLLAFEAYENLNMGNVPCSLITGEEQYLIEGAKHTASTVEILDTEQYYDLAVIDEAQMIKDPERGWAWTTAVLGVCAGTVHVCLAPEAEEILIKMIVLCHDTYEIVRHERMTPLKEDTQNFTFPKSVQEHDALIVFSKRDVIQCAAELQRKKIPCSIIYGALPYEVRQNEVSRFVSGETKVVVATDAIGMGMNLPIKRIVFLQNEKFDGIMKRDLDTSEIKQIAGRAGRKGLYDEGLYKFAYGSKRMRAIMNGHIPPLKTAPLGFPPYLLSINEPLSVVMNQWMKMENDDIFTKADLKIQYTLCLELEQETDDKRLIYDFITIPFDENNPGLKGLWKQMFTSEKDGIHMPFTAPPYEKNSMDDMEESYKICDLMFFYLRKFTDGAELNAVMDYKKRITDDMSAYLKKQKLPVKKCKYCGKTLPWNYPYNMCEKCYHRHFSYGYDYWY